MPPTPRSECTSLLLIVVRVAWDRVPWHFSPVWSIVPVPHVERNLQFVEWELQPHSPAQAGSKRVTAPKSQYIFFIITAISHTVNYIRCMRKYEWKETGENTVFWNYKPSVNAAMECLAFMHFRSNHDNELVLFISHLLISNKMTI
jgi:hypothetical protein